MCEMVRKLVGILRLQIWIHGADAYVFLDRVTDKLCGHFEHLQAYTSVSALPLNPLSESGQTSLRIYIAVSTRETTVCVPCYLALFM